MGFPTNNGTTQHILGPDKEKTFSGKILNVNMIGGLLQKFVNLVGNGNDSDEEESCSHSDPESDWTSNGKSPERPLSTGRV